jgi:transposase
MNRQYPGDVTGRQLPVDFPNWKSVDTVFWRWRNEAIWQRIHDALREQTMRSTGKRKTPPMVLKIAVRDVASFLA